MNDVILIRDYRSIFTTRINAKSPQRTKNRKKFNNKKINKFKKILLLC